MASQHHTTADCHKRRCKTGKRALISCRLRQSAGVVCNHMKAPIKIFIIVISAIIGLFLIGKFTGALGLYHCTTNVNAPTLKKDETFMCSNLLKPKRFKFIRYFQNTKDYGKQIHIMRVCGLPGDTIWIREGLLYVNGQQADLNLSLAHNYLIRRHDLAGFEQYNLSIEALEWQPKDTLNLTFADKDVQQ